uniref:Ankyrin repeat domain-containing protein n=1 Tax=Meloidogyne floridensis TaxID=298350 RepID=A0A915PA06_9BILA
MFNAGQLFESLLSSGAGNGLLQQLAGAVQGGDFGSILNSISGGADVNEKDEKNGTTPLQMAIMAGLTEIVKLLLSKGASVNQTNNEGKNALDIAKQGVDDAPDDETKVKFQEMVQMLVQHSNQ